MDTLSKSLSHLPGLNPNLSNTISIKVPRNSLRSAHDNGLFKTDIISRNLAYLPIKRRVNVEASVEGTSDSVFFTPEQANADMSNCRSSPVQFVKVRPADHDDIVYQGDDFEIEFIGMNCTPQDSMFGGNDLLLCSLTTDDEAQEREKAKDIDAENSVVITPTATPTATPIASRQGSASSEDVDADGVATTSSVDKEKAEALAASGTNVGTEEEESKPAELPSSLHMTNYDLPFIHYDPEYDGHDVGSRPDTFVPIPGSKRLYLQRKGKFAPKEDQESPALYMRFTVMEVDKLSEEQISAIKSIEMIGKSVSNAAASVPYLKIISSMLKFANYLGKSALKKVSEPDHVMSVDVGFKLAQRVEEQNAEGQKVLVLRPRQEEIGNYLRYGYYFFLNKKVDARLYAQTGASSQSISLLLKREGYLPKVVNEKDYFPLTGVSYVVIKVTRGCSPVRKDRGEVAEMHRQRLIGLLQKYQFAEEKAQEKLGAEQVKKGRQGGAMGAAPTATPKPE